MFKKLSLCTLFLIPLQVYATSTGCATVGASIESSLFATLSKDLNIDTSTIQRDKTQVAIIDSTVVSQKYAESLAKNDWENAVASRKLSGSEDVYFSSYYQNDATTLTAKYTYFNQEGKKDVFIASGLINKDECSIRFNGYLTLAREF